MTQKYMTYEQKDYSRLIGMAGFSETMLTNHFTLYGGYVKNVNMVIESLKLLKANSPEYNELKRRFGWEWNGMKMHEFYFGNLSKEVQQVNTDSKLYKDITAQWGSYEAWLEDFKATGLIRGIGWVVLAKDRDTGFLMNLWIGEHDEGHLCNQDIVLVMDIWEHAYATDYGIKKADYINAFVGGINWKEVESRSL
jgi:Fe-Mn family superoxide dismutase